MHASIDRSAEYTRPRGRLVTDGGMVSSRAARTDEGGATTGPATPIRHRTRQAARRGKETAKAGTRKVGAAVPTSLPTSVPSDLSTEQAVTIFGALAGVGGFFAQVLAARRLSTLPGETVALRSLFPAVIVLSISVVVAARFIPSG